jgi:carbon monoxide dehydrogenase subunit G
MKVDIDKTFPLPGPADAAWEFLQDVEAVAACMPGAKITERSPGGGYKGTVTVRVGPATMSFRGEVDVHDVDPAARSLRLLGKGTDTTGSSGASMELHARIEEVGDGASNLVGHSEVSMSGKAAAFGGRMMNSVADQVLKQFAENFAAGVAALSARRTASAPSSTPTAGVVSAPQIMAANPPPSVDAGLTASAPPRAANELNGISLLWAVIKDWLRRLFGKKAS